MDEHDDNDDAVVIGAPAQAFWDQRYASIERVWSGEPNGALVREAGGLQPGQALDVGCGEGADAVWLAHNVTAGAGAHHTHDTVLRAIRLS